MIHPEYKVSFLLFENLLLKHNKRKIGDKDIVIQKRRNKFNKGARCVHDRSLGARRGTAWNGRRRGSRAHRCTSWHPTERNVGPHSSLKSEISHRGRVRQGANARSTYNDGERRY